VNNTERKRLSRRKRAAKTERAGAAGFARRFALPARSSRGGKSMLDTARGFTQFSSPYLGLADVLALSRGVAASDGFDLVVVAP